MKHILLITLIGLASSTALAFSRMDPEEPEYNRHDECEPSEDTMELTKEQRRLIGVALHQYVKRTSHVVFTEREEQIMLKVADEMLASIRKE